MYPPQGYGYAGMSLMGHVNATLVMLDQLISLYTCRMWFIHILLLGLVSMASASFNGQCKFLFIFW